MTLHKRRPLQVLASYGHVRDLPPKAGSVDPQQSFALRWEVGPRQFRPLKEIADAARASKHVVLATDPDREGEAISWHVTEVRASGWGLLGSSRYLISLGAVALQICHSAAHLNARR